MEDAVGSPEKMSKKALCKQPVSAGFEKDAARSQLLFSIELIADVLSFPIGMSP